MHQDQSPVIPSISASALSIRHRAMVSAELELKAMESEIEHYEDEFSAPQLRAMRKVMISLRAYIATLEA